MGISGTQADMLTDLGTATKFIADTMTTGEKPKQWDDWSDVQKVAYCKDLQDKGVELSSESQDVQEFAKQMSEMTKDFGTENVSQNNIPQKSAKSFNLKKAQLQDEPLENDQDFLTEDQLVNVKFKDASSIKNILDTLDFEGAMEWLAEFVNSNSLITDERTGKATESLGLVKDALNRFYASEDEQEKLEQASLIFDKIIPDGKKEIITEEEGNIPAEYEDNIKAKISMITETEQIIKKMAQQDAKSSKGFNLKKQAQAKTIENVFMFGPENNKVDAFTGQLISDWHLIERNKGFGGKIDDVFNIDWEGTWRKNVMDKYFREYRDENGNWVGGYIESRFEVDRNVPPINDYQLKPNELRKPYIPELSHTEARLEANRTKLNKERGYSPAEKGSPFNWKEANAKTAQIESPQIKHELKTVNINGEEFVAFSNEYFNLPSEYLDHYGIKRTDKYYVIPKAEFDNNVELQNYLKQIGVDVSQYKISKTLSKNTKIAQQKFIVEPKETLSGNPSYLVKDVQSNKVVAAFSSSPLMYGEKAEEKAKLKAEELNKTKEAQSAFIKKKLNKIADLPPTKQPRDIFKDPNASSVQQLAWCPKCGGNVSPGATQCSNENCESRKLGQSIVPVLTDPRTRPLEKGEQVAPPIQKDKFVQRNQQVLGNSNVAKEIYFDGNKFYCFANSNKISFKTYKEAKSFKEKEKSPSDLLVKQKQLRPNVFKQLPSDPEEELKDEDLDRDEVELSADSLGIDG